MTAKIVKHCPHTAKVSVCISKRYTLASASEYMAKAIAGKLLFSTHVRADSKARTFAISHFVSLDSSGEYEMIIRHDELCEDLRRACMPYVRRELRRMIA
jgi:hypothetical protein